MRKISFLLGLVLLTFVIGMGSCATPKKDSQAKPQPAPSLTHPISMVWQHKDDPSVDLSSLPKVPGLTVVSPCWYRVTGEYGKVEGAAVPGYTERAHKKGYQVWPLVTNSFDPDLTHKFLQDPHAQRFIIDQLLKEAETHGFDGINIDFENIYEKDRDALTSFMAYLRRQSQKKGLILSMDVTAPSRNPNWSRCYDRKALTKSVDYLVLMTYDQFSRLSKVPGPTASFNWDEKKVQETLAQGVPPEKLLFGLPLYMRLWEAPEGTKEYRARTLGMWQAQQLIHDKKNLPTFRKTWLPEEKMTRVSYTEGGRDHVFWQEDALSLYYKSRLAIQYQLAGTAAWRYGFETPDVWHLLEISQKNGAHASQQ